MIAAQPGALTDDQLALFKRIQALSQLAAKNTSEAEAASALAKMNELLARHNLDLAAVEQARPEDGRREEARVEGGFYRWQRDLWDAVARLNFCMHWVGVTWVRARVPRLDRWSGRWVTAEREVRRRRHEVVGRVVNTRATIAMAGYLEQVAERVVRDKVAGTDVQRNSNWAVSFRRGVVARIIEKVEERQLQFAKEEAERVRKAKHAVSRAGVSVSRAVTVQQYQDAEHDANVDFVFGDGTSARWAKERAEAAAEKKREREAYTRWARKHPEEARKKEEEARRKQRRSYGRAERDSTDYGAYYSGYDAAADVGIDRQAEGTRVAGRIGR